MTDHDATYLHASAPTVGTSYAASALSGDYDEVFSGHERGTPVRLMATMSGLVAATAEEPLEAALEMAKPHGFDFLPVTDGKGGPVVGLLCTDGARGEGGARVRDAMASLSGANLIGADAPLLHFVCEADRAPCRLVLDGASISGIVTLSDFQRLPVRTALFGLFIHLEMLLTERLRKLLQTDPIEVLEGGSKKHAFGRWDKARAGRIERDQYDVLTFSDKLFLASGLSEIPFSREEMQHDLKCINDKLRNPIAHGNVLASSRASASEVAKAARALREWTVRFRNWR